MEKKGLLMQECPWWSCWKALDTFNTLDMQMNGMEKQDLLMRGCWWSCWKALKTFKTIENTNKYYGKARFINAGMLAQLFESIESLLNH